MKKEEAIELNGIVSETLPGAKFEVQLEENNNVSVICTLSGKLRQNNIKILKGDSVKIQISPYDLTKGRIVWRSK